MPIAITDINKPKTILCGQLRKRFEFTLARDWRVNYKKYAHSHHAVSCYAMGDENQSTFSV